MNLHFLRATFALVTFALFAGTPTLVAANDTDSWATASLAKSKGQSNVSSRKSLSRAERSNLGGQMRSEARRNDSKRRPSLSGGSISWQASSGCVPGQLRGVLANVAATFGPVTVTSTCRSASQNRAAGGAGKSYHLSGEAVDFRTHGSTGAVYAYLSGNGGVGGLKHYGGGLFHIDTGPRRSW